MGPKLDDNKTNDGKQTGSGDNTTASGSGNQSSGAAGEQRTVSKLVKEFNTLGVTKFRPSGSNLFQKASQANKYNRRIKSAWRALDLADSNKRLRVFEQFDYDLYHKIESGISDRLVNHLETPWGKFEGKFKLYFQVPALEEEARSKLTKVKQLDGESAIDLRIRITQMYEDSNWGDQDKEAQIRSYFLSAIRDPQVEVQYKFSLMPDKTPLTLDALVEIANIYERTSSNSAHKVNRVNQGSQGGNQVNQIRRGSSGYKKPNNQNKNKGQNSKCIGCGDTKGKHKYKTRACPAYNKECGQCRKKHHWAQQCMSSGAQKSNNSGGHNSGGQNKNQNNQGSSGKKFNKKGYTQRRVEQEGSEETPDQGPTAADTFPHVHF